MQLFDQDEQILCFFRVPSTDEAERHRDLDWNSYPPSVTTSEIATDARRIESDRGRFYRVRGLSPGERPAETIFAT